MSFCLTSRHFLNIFEVHFNINFLIFNDYKKEMGEGLVFILLPTAMQSQVTIVCNEKLALN